MKASETAPKVSTVGYHIVLSTHWSQIATKPILLPKASPTHLNTPPCLSENIAASSAATIAVLPEVDDVEVEVNPNDVRVDVYRSSGNGGQCVNTTDSAVRLTHMPTGLVVTCQDEKSQIKNKEKAFKVLRSRLYDMMMKEQHEKQAADRQSQVGSGDRSDRIRTYNFPQGRVSDHRIGLTIYKLDAFLDGDIDDIVDPLITAQQAEKMKNF